MRVVQPVLADFPATALDAFSAPLPTRPPVFDEVVTERDGQRHLRITRPLVRWGAEVPASMLEGLRPAS